MYRTGSGSSAVEFEKCVTQAVNVILHNITWSNNDIHDRRSQ